MLISGSKARMFLYILMAMAAILIIGCASSSQPPSPAQTPASPPIPQRTRAEAIPTDAVKMTPQLDTLPPKLHSTEYQEPIPLGSGVNTAGGEDSAFVTPDGNTLYFFFTPDVSIPAQKQLLDGVTCIYVSHKQGDQWQPSTKVVLQDKDELSLDACPFVSGNTMWFCSARKGNIRDVDMWTAEFKDGHWTNWQDAGAKLNADYQIGEVHITADGNELYFHSARPGGKGYYDIWVCHKVNGEWQEPENVEAVNTPETEGWPFVTQDGNQLWFTRNYMGTPAIFRSEKIDGKWGEPEVIISQFAAEPSLDNAGNLYFAHHFFKDDRMIEADIYIAPIK